MSTSVEHRPFCSSANASSNRQSDNDACSTSNKPPNINSADEPNPPLSHNAFCLKSFDDGHLQGQIDDCAEVVLGEFDDVDGRTRPGQLLRELAFGRTPAAGWPIPRRVTRQRE